MLQRAEALARRLQPLLARGLDLVVAPGRAALALTIEAARVALEARIDQFDRDSRARDAVLEAIRQNSTDIRKNSEDIRVLAARVEALGPLDQRVSALERRFGDG